MINISKEPDLRKQESHDTTAAAASKTTSWSRLKDPRIVRVSRAFGGKDRHSKVCTVKGLRDRRVRLSVPTAIQLYDLQDRLGLNQPSKVVDWLLHAARNEIDQLPPLQFPPGAFPIMDPKHVPKDDAVAGTEDHQDCNWGNQAADSSCSNSYVAASMPYNNAAFARWDPPNLSLAHDPSRMLQHHQTGGDWPSFNLMGPSSGSHPHHDHDHHQVLHLYHQHGMSSTTQSYFPNYSNNNNNNESGTANSPTEPVRQLHFNMMTANLLPSQNDDAS